jgi:predicted acylesterase/phospholipase RssA
MNDTVHSPYANPQRECDLVMKGGVTSGLVYPQAVLELAHGTEERPGYRFRAIGGASAGAVAAVFAAAAEFNRPAGFSELEKVNAELQQSDGNTSFLQRLFQAKSSMRPLLNIALRLDDYKDYAASAGLLRTVFKVVGDNGIPGLKRGAALGALAGVFVAAALAGLIALVSPAAVFGSAWTVLGLALAIVGGAIGWVYAGLTKIVSLLTVDLPKNYFGICSGMKEPEAAQDAATEWIHDSTQKIAGTDDVLTFGQLRDRGVTLELMTTNISEGRPYAFPFDDPFVFCREDFDKLFPAKVVTAMVEAGERRSRTTYTGVKLPAGYHFMPAPDELPVTVAARMSMSFPLFFSSVPLYAFALDVRERLASDPKLAYNADRTALIPHWFSDGGIASNFPIHFFDAWLPTRPTFGITLRYLPGFLYSDAANTPEERLAAEHYRKSMGIGDGAARRPMAKQLEAAASGNAAQQEEHLVVLPRPEDSVPLEWSHISSPRNPRPGLDSVPNFLWAVIGSMQNYRDNLQAALPSYRERVAQIRLGPNEGGFNLDMDESLIKRIVAKGRLAGEKLDTEFIDKHHKWVRLLVLTSELEQGFRRIREKQTDTHFAELINEQCCTEGYPYREKDTAVCEALRARLAALSAAMEAWASASPRDPFKGGSPPAVMRVTPKI